MQRDRIEQMFDQFEFEIVVSGYEPSNPETRCLIRLANTAEATAVNDKNRPPPCAPLLIERVAAVQLRAFQCAKSSTRSDSVCKLAARLLVIP